MQQFKVSGMSCGHCVRAVTQAIKALDPAAQVPREAFDPCHRVEAFEQRLLVLGGKVREGEGYHH